MVTLDLQVPPDPLAPLDPPVMYIREHSSTRAKWRKSTMSRSYKRYIHSQAGLCYELIRFFVAIFVCGIEIDRGGNDKNGYERDTTKNMPRH